MINKKKSGILVIHNHSMHDEDINCYPIKNNYKYKGIKLDANLSHVTDVYTVNKRLSNFLKESNGC